MYAFFSFHHEDRVAAGRVREALKEFGVSSFLAHEDIGVSHEWQLRIFDELGKADTFVALLSERYLTSAYCLQESGIAIFRRMPIIPFSIDNTIPPGFLHHIQSRRIDPENVDEHTVLSGIARWRPDVVIGKLTNRLVESGSFRQAESDFRSLLPFLGVAKEEQIVRVLQVSSDNGQVCCAHLCAEKYLPPLFEQYGHLLDEPRRTRLQERINAYR
jgi:hypothetical protein